MLCSHYHLSYAVWDPIESLKGVNMITSNEQAAIFSFRLLPFCLHKPTVINLGSGNKKL